MKSNLKYENLTLPSRVELFSDMEKCTLNKGKHAHALIQISIDDYSDISDYFGVDIAREITFMFSNWLKFFLPNRSAKLYRFEMDKFVIYVTARTTVKAVDAYVKSLISRISRKSFLVRGNLYNISLTIGVARGRDELFKRSYLALIKAKKKDKTYLLYCNKENMEEEFLRNINIHHEIKDAIEKDRILAYYQPIYDSKNSKVIKYEALMRLKNSKGEIKSPIEFLDVAKKVKLYNQLTKKMVFILLENLKILKEPVTMNLSINDIENYTISNFVFNSIRDSKLGSYITIEIIETEEINSFVKVTNFIKKMKSLGCKFAVDDFGSGFSNFEHLLKLDIDYLKIDGSLIKNINNSVKNEILVKNIISFAKELGIKTIAEYVYNKSVYDKVNKLGIDYVQGNYIGKAKSLSVAWYNIFIFYRRILYGFDEQR